jgi:hypothetical protein
MKNQWRSFQVYNRDMVTASNLMQKWLRSISKS